MLFTQTPDGLIALLLMIKHILIGNKSPLLEAYNKKKNPILLSGDERIFEEMKE